MGQSRTQLQTILSEMGADHVYFQPPTNVKLQYPCIIYDRDFSKTLHAGNSPYRNTKRYQVTVIDRDPDSVIPDKVEEMPLCSFSRFFAADDLNHYVFNLYF